VVAGDERREDRRRHRELDAALSACEQQFRKSWIVYASEQCAASPPSVETWEEREDGGEDEHASAVVGGGQGRGLDIKTSPPTSEVHRRPSPLAPAH
jgi:hypothetical protein